MDIYIYIMKDQFKEVIANLENKGQFVLADKIRKTMVISYPMYNRKLHDFTESVKFVKVNMSKNRFRLPLFGLSTIIGLLMYSVNNTKDPTSFIPKMMNDNKIKDNSIFENKLLQGFNKKLIMTAARNLVKVQGLSNKDWSKIINLIKKCKKDLYVIKSGKHVTNVNLDMDDHILVDGKEKIVNFFISNNSTTQVNFTDGTWAILEFDEYGGDESKGTWLTKF